MPRSIITINIWGVHYSLKYLYAKYQLNKLISRYQNLILQFRSFCMKGTVCLCACMCACVCICLQPAFFSVCVCMRLYLPVCLSVCLAVYLPVCVCEFACLCLCVCLSICVGVHVCVHPNSLCACEYMQVPGFFSVPFCRIVNTLANVNVSE